MDDDPEGARRVPPHPQRQTREPRRFANQVPFLAYLAEKGIDIFDRDIIRPFAEAGIWGAIRHHDLVGDVVIVSDDAGQFRVGTVSRNGRLAHDSMPGLMKTCQKLGLSFWHYLGDRLGIGNEDQPVPPLATIVAARC